MTVLEQFRLDDKTALVTGGSRGLGRSMALAFAQAGANLIVTARDARALEKIAREIRATGADAQIKSVDMADPGPCREALERLLKEHGPVDILVNNVGNRLTSAAIHEQSLESWQKTIDLNLTSCFLGSRIVGAAMIERGGGGRIINIASMNAFVANQGIGDRAYETAKAAIVQFTRAAAADWAPYGITVNAICPGLFMTDANRDWQQKKPQVIEKLIAGIPLGRAGEPHEIGPLAVFLASPAAAFMTGCAVTIDGGYTLW